MSSKTKENGSIGPSYAPPRQRKHDVSPNVEFTAASQGADRMVSFYFNNLPGHTELFLVIPIREWNDGQTERTVGATQ